MNYCILHVDVPLCIIVKLQLKNDGTALLLCQVEKAHHFSIQI